MPAAKICERLKKKDDAICSLEWGEQLKTVSAELNPRFCCVHRWCRRIAYNRGCCAAQGKAKKEL
jgi:hypothetical protein